MIITTHRESQGFRYIFLLQTQFYSICYILCCTYELIYSIVLFSTMLSFSSSQMFTTESHLLDICCQPSLTYIPTIPSFFLLSYFCIFCIHNFSNILHIHSINPLKFYPSSEVTHLHSLIFYN